MKNEPQTIKTSEAIIVLIVTAASYLAAYVFELSYISHFDIPKEFITISIEKMMSAGIGILTFFFLSMWFINPITLFISNKINILGSYMQRVISLNVIALILMPITYLAYESYLKGLLILGTIVIFLDLPIIIASIFRKISSKEKTFSQHVVEACEENKRKDAWQILTSKFGNNIVWPFLFVVFTIGIAHASGAYTVRKTNSFTAYEDMVLIRKYGDSYIFKKYDKNENKLKDELKILDSATIAKLSLKTIKIKDLNP